MREQVFAALLGRQASTATPSSAAFRIPNLLRDLFAEGALSAAFVPTYARALAGEGRAAAFRLASRLMTLLSVLLAALVLLGIALAPQLVGVLAPGFERVPGKAEITVVLTRIMLPFLPLVSLAAVAMGMLNAHERFTMPAFALRGVQRGHDRMGGGPVGARFRSRTGGHGLGDRHAPGWGGSVPDPGAGARGAKGGASAPTGPRRTRASALSAV